MSEAITQVRYGCAGMKTVPCGDVDVRGKGPVMCPDCSGTGRVPDVEATLRAEVARLTTHVDGLVKVNRIQFDVAKSQEAAHLSLMQTTTAYYEAEVARLTAEVERLKGREQAAKPLITAIKEDGIGVVFCPCCWKYWTEDASGCADGCPRAAWLAGCKP